jgi:predicted site-specific integrase-resolvase
MTTTDRTELTTMEAAKRFDVALRTLYRLIDEGRLPAFRSEKMIYVLEDDMVELVSSGVELPPFGWTPHGS